MNSESPHVSERSASSRKHRHRSRGPSPAVAEPRRPLLLAVLSFVRAAAVCPGVQRISLLGSLATAKAIPKDVDLLVTIDGAMELTELARISRQLMGSAQTVNLGADIFLADATGRYLGRVCRYRECHPRVRCLAQHCGQKAHLNDDLHVVTLSQELITSPSVDLWPKVARRVAVPPDVENLLLTKLERDQ
jgi:predicted nucleotidyltransferase